MGQFCLFLLSLLLKLARYDEWGHLQDFPRPQAFLQGYFWVMRPRNKPPGSSIFTFSFCVQATYAAIFMIWGGMKLKGYMAEKK